jgi:SAM-dependent methyltransferase
LDLGLYDTIYKIEDSHWWFVGRRAIVFDQLRRVLHGTGVRPRILDLGCGTGRNIVTLQEFGDAVGLDLEERALELSWERGVRSLVQASAEALPFLDDSFDVVLALDLLEHLDDDLAGASEIARVLRPGAQLLVFAPAYRWLWGHQDVVSHHHRRYTPRSLAGVIESAGLRISRLTHANLLLLPLILGGRVWLRAARKHVATENTLASGWSNGLLRRVFCAERYFLRKANLPLGVSLLCVATRDGMADADQPSISVRTSQCAASAVS